MEQSFGAQVKFFFGLCLISLVAGGYIFYEAEWIVIFAIPVITMQMSFMPKWFHMFAVFVYGVVLIANIFIFLTIRFGSGGTIAELFPTMFEDESRSLFLIGAPLIIMLCSTISHFRATAGR